MNYQTLQNTAYRRAKIADATTKAGINADLNIAEQIVAGLRFWNELSKTGTLSVVVGTTTYALASDVDDVEQILITSPVAYEREIPHRSKVEGRRQDPVLSNTGTGAPIWWEWSEPTIANGVETKNIQIYPNPDQAYTLTYSYKRELAGMSATTDQPFFNPRFHHILIDYALWKEAETNPDQSKNPVYFRDQWQGPNYPVEIGGGLGELLRFTSHDQTKEELTIPGPDRI